MHSEKRLNVTELAFAAGMVMLALVILYDSFSIRLGISYDRIGPRFFPFIVSAGLLVTAMLMIVESLHGKGQQSPYKIRKLPLVLLGLALITCLLLFERLGFIVAVSIQFWLIARAFNSLYPLRDAIIGIVLAVTIYFAFTQGLGLVLPRGILSSLI